MCFSFALLSFGASCATGFVFLYFVQYLTEVWCCCCCFFFILLVFCFIRAGPFRVSVSRFNVCEYDLSTCIDNFRCCRFIRTKCLQNCVCVSFVDWLTAWLPNWLPIAHVFDKTQHFSLWFDNANLLCVFIFLAFCRILAVHLSCVHQVAQLVTKSRTNRNIYIRYSTLVTDNLCVYCITLTKLLA